MTGPATVVPPDRILRRFLEGSTRVSSHIVATHLFGSRARGTERPDSDYDLLLVVTDAFSPADKDALYELVMDVLLETGRLISLKIFRQSAFEHLRQLQTPFIRHVLTEGIHIG